MGMSASQARLLSITARLSDNEANAQSLSYSKQRLADETDQVYQDYIAALDATKLTVMTGFSGSEATYTDISYSLLTGYDSVALGRQYIVTNADGEILVTKKQAAAYEAGNGDFNTFLAELGYTQADISNDSDEDALTKIHEAWDAYFASVGISFDDDEHAATTDLEFAYTTFDGSSTANNGYITCTATSYSYVYDDDGNITYDDDGEAVTTSSTTSSILNYEGTTEEQRELYDYAVAITEQYYSNGTYTNSSGTTYTLETADDVDAAYITYLQNIFNKMASCGYYTEDSEADTIKDNAWFEEQITSGKLLLEYYSSTEGGFVSTTVSEDEAIQEVDDDTAIAKAEAQYNQDTADLENQDEKFDLELKRLDTEHNALQTEYDSVKDVIDKNVEKSFSIFS